MPPLPFTLADFPREPPLSEMPIDTLGYLPMRGQRPSWVTVDEVTAWDIPESAGGFAPSPPRQEPYFGKAVKYGKTAKYAGSAGLTMKFMYNAAPSLHRLILKRLPPPGRLDFDTDRCTVVPALAFRLAGGKRGEHLVHRLQWEDEGKVILGKLAASLLVTSFRALTE